MDKKERTKNILDLQFQKYLIIASTSAILGFTYFIGIGIAILTKQINLADFSNMLAVFVLTAGVLGIFSALFLDAIFHIKNILDIIREI